MRLHQFPAALCDPDGYVIFLSRDESAGCQQLNIGTRLNVQGGNASVPGYARVEAPST